MSSVRLRRLAADFTKLKEYVRCHPRLRLIQSSGDPPEQYQLEYLVHSLRQVDGELKPVKKHIVEITLPRNYPRTPPQCRMLTPVFHPNIAPHAVCVGDHWSAGESLQAIVTRIGEMLAYQSYNVKSPLNGEAARWAEENEAKLPLDAVSMLPEEGGAGADVPASPPEASHTAPPPVPPPPSQAGVAAPPSSSAPTPRPAAPAQPQPSAATGPAPAQAPTAPTAPTAPQPGPAVTCPKCQSKLRLPAGRPVTKVRCRKCMHVFAVKTS